MRWRRIILTCAPLIVVACSRDEEGRRELLQNAQQRDMTIATGAVVRDLRAPPDTGRLIYEPVVNLSARSAMAPRVWAPFGIATPDTTSARITTPPAN